MTVWLRLLQAPWMVFLASILLCAIWGVFAYSHFLAFEKTRQLQFLIFCFSETLVALFFVFRRNPQTVSVNAFDWVVAIVGTFAALFFRPASWGVLPAAGNAIIVGAVIQLLGMLSLNRSFALVAAKREIKTQGMFQFVRHPLYASYVLTFTGYVLANTTPVNVFIYVITMACLLIRINREEKHLAQDSVYLEYMSKVRYRIIPFVF